MMGETIAIVVVSGAGALAGFIVILIGQMALSSSEAARAIQEHEAEAGIIPPHEVHP